MLYAITLRYARPKIEVEAQLEPHRRWLAAEIQANRILAAGPIDSGQGGFVLAFAERRDEIDAMIARDPFRVHGLATFDVAAFQPAVRSPAFPATWAPDARVIA